MAFCIVRNPAAIFTAEYLQYYISFRKYEVSTCCTKEKQTIVTYHDLISDC